jgi:hypothetical protein
VSEVELEVSAGGHDGTVSMASERDQNRSKRSIETAWEPCDRVMAHLCNYFLADEITKRVAPAAFAQGRGSAAFRKLRSGLNKRLTEKG